MLKSLSNVKKLIEDLFHMAFILWMFSVVNPVSWFYVILAFFVGGWIL